MRIDTEENQKFLALMWALQNNASNATKIPRNIAREILNQKVFRAYDHIELQHFYSLKPIADISKHTDIDMPAKKNAGGRPQILTKQEKEKICEWNNLGISKREISRRLGVSDWTIRNFLKGF